MGNPLPLRPGLPNLGVLCCSCLSLCDCGVLESSDLVQLSLEDRLGEPGCAHWTLGWWDRPTVLGLTADDCMRLLQSSCSYPMYSLLGIQPSPGLHLVDTQQTPYASMPGQCPV